MDQPITSTKAVAFASLGDETTYIWKESMETDDFRDYQVPYGIVAAHYYHSNFKKALSIPIFHLLTETFHGHGLIRKRSKHYGSQFIVGTKHSRQSNQITGQSRQDMHDYTNEKHTNQALLPMARSAVNYMSTAALKMSESSGAIMGPILFAATVNEDEETRAAISSNSTVVTTFLANTPHGDPDFIKIHYQAFMNHVEECNAKEVTEYLGRFKIIFPELHKKKLLPLDTTCCWVQMKQSDIWNHYQYFMSLEILLAYDLSSDVMGPETQLASTFYAGLFSHLTSRPLWISKDGSKVSTVCPEEYCGNWGWGKYSKNK